MSSPQVNPHPDPGSRGGQQHPDRESRGGQQKTVARARCMQRRARRCRVSGIRTRPHRRQPAPAVQPVPVVHIRGAIPGRHAVAEAVVTRVCDRYQPSVQGQITSGGQTDMDSRRLAADRVRPMLAALDRTIDSLRQSRLSATTPAPAAQPASAVPHMQNTPPVAPRRPSLDENGRPRLKARPMRRDGLGQ